MTDTHRTAENVDLKRIYAEQPTLLGDLRGGLCSSGLCRQLRAVAADEIVALTEERRHMAEALNERAKAEKEHCKDCCCARSWMALGVSGYTGMSIPEHITELRESLRELVEWWEKDGGYLDASIERAKKALAPENKP